jgi:hypothetical protein
LLYPPLLKRWSRVPFDTRTVRPSLQFATTRFPAITIFHKEKRPRRLFTCTLFRFLHHGILTSSSSSRSYLDCKSFDHRNLPECAFPVISPCPAIHFPILPTCTCNRTSRHHMDRLPSHKHRTIFCSLQPFLQVPQTSVTSSNASTCSSSLWRKKAREMEGSTLLLHFTLTIRLSKPSKLGPARVGFQDQTRGYSRYDRLVGGAHPTGRAARSWVAHECDRPNSPTGAVNIRTNVGNTLRVVREQAVLCCRPVAPQRATHLIASHPTLVGGKGEAPGIRRVSGHDVVQPSVTQCLSLCCELQPQT